MRRPISFIDLPRALPLLAVMLVGGCSKLLSLTSPKADVAAAVAGMNVVQGDLQTGQAGRTLATPIVLRVVDAKGKGVAKQAVTLLVVTGGGTVDPSTAVSDSLGELKVRWTLGTSVASQSLTASTDGVDPLVVRATGLFPTSMLVAQGAAQTAKIATALKNDVVVRVQGANGLPMVGLPVTFRVTTGGGAITPQSATTNSAGEVSAKWTLGALVGGNSVLAESGTLAPVTVSATATP